MQLTPPRDQKNLRRLGLSDAQTNIGFQFFPEARSELAGGDVLSLSSGHGAAVDPEGHPQGRLHYVQRGKRFRVLRAGDGLADTDWRYPGHSNNIPRVRALSRYPL